MLVLKELVLVYFNEMSPNANAENNICIYNIVTIVTIF